MAVNLASEEPYHNALNEKLVKETIELAEQVNHTEVHLVGAYPVTPINIAIELPEFDRAFITMPFVGNICWQ